MSKLLAIGLGGAGGALLRYFISGWVHQIYLGSIPLGTAVVNLVGSFLIGFLLGSCELIYISPIVKSFLTMGLLGSFTTFSTYTWETFYLIRDSEWGLFILNTAINVLGGIIFVFLGFLLSRIIFNIGL